MGCSACACCCCTCTELDLHLDSRHSAYQTTALHRIQVVQADKIYDKVVLRSYVK